MISIETNCSIFFHFVRTNEYWNKKTKQFLIYLLIQIYLIFIIMYQHIHILFLSFRYVVVVIVVIVCMFYKCKFIIHFFTFLLFLYIKRKPTTKIWRFLDCFQVIIIFQFLLLFSSSSFVLINVIFIRVLYRLFSYLIFNVTLFMSL